MIINLNPVEREYRVGDTDRIFIKPQSENQGKQDLVDAVVLFIEEGRPVFRVTSEGIYHNQVFRIWQVIFV